MVPCKRMKRECCMLRLDAGPEASLQLPPQLLAVRVCLLCFLAGTGHWYIWTGKAKQISVIRESGDLPSS